MLHVAALSQEYNVQILYDHSLFDVFELLVFMWFCEVWVVSQQVDHIRNDVLGKEGDEFFCGKRDKNLF